MNVNLDGEDSIRRRASSNLPDLASHLRVEVRGLLCFLVPLGPEVTVMLVEPAGMFVEREIAAIIFPPFVRILISLLSQVLYNLYVDIEETFNKY